MFTNSFNHRNVYDKHKKTLFSKRTSASVNVWQNLAYNTTYKQIQQLPSTDPHNNINTNRIDNVFGLTSIFAAFGCTPLIYDQLSIFLPNTIRTFCTFPNSSFRAFTQSPALFHSQQLAGSIRHQKGTLACVFRVWPNYERRRRRAVVVQRKSPNKRAYNTSEHDALSRVSHVSYSHFILANTNSRSRSN